MDRDSYVEGYEAGFAEAINILRRQNQRVNIPRLDDSTKRLAKMNGKPKRKQSKKQKILTDMSKKAWDKYKKGNGKKTYIDIRAQVSRSVKYKKATKGM